MDKTTITQLFWLTLSTIIGIIALPIMIIKELVESVKEKKGFEYYRCIMQFIMCGIGGLFHWFFIDMIWETYPIWLLF